MAYEYPADLPAESLETGKEELERLETVATDIMEGCQTVAEHLERIILDYTSSPESRKLDVLANLLERTSKLAKGDVLPLLDQFAVDGVSPLKTAALHLQEIVSITEDTIELLWHRRVVTQEVERTIRFGLGDVVKHTEYGFRGVVVAWDEKPRVDVSRWDGLQHIDKPESYPFYHIIPDQEDCFRAFGGERPSRYVCEANLETCPESEMNIDVDLEPEWTCKPSEGSYIPPQDLVFKYGGDIGDDGITKQCLVELRDSLTQLLVSVRDSAPIGVAALGEASEKLAMPNLLDILKHAPSMETATIISDCLKEIWRAHSNMDLRHRLETAVELLLGGKTQEALIIFSQLADEDPNYAEAWNKASTCEFMLGNLEAALASAQKTLEILPNHFQALNGLGVTYYEKNDLPAAVNSFEKSLELDPWSPVSARLSMCLDTIQRWQPPEDTNGAGATK